MIQSLPLELYFEIVGNDEIIYNLLLRSDPKFARKLTTAMGDHFRFNVLGYNVRIRKKARIEVYDGEISGKCIVWTKSGIQHRRDGPSIEMENGSSAWYINGKLHRKDGPAVEDSDGSCYWYKYGKLHRENGPAIERTNGSKEWFFEGKRHREDGPAIKWSDGYEHWLIKFDKRP